MKDAGPVAEPLKAYLEECVGLAKRCVDAIDSPTETVFHAMIWAYLRKQINHARSVQVLASNYDALLVVRTMIEALCQLYWVAQQRDTRAQLWSDFRHVYNFKLLLQKKESGIPIEGGFTEDRIRTEIAAYAKRYLSDKEVKLLGRATLGNNPFRQAWTLTSIYKIMADVKAEDLYQRNYFYCSEWAHSSVSILEMAMAEVDNIESDVIRSPSVESLALVMAFQSVFETAKMANDEFVLKLEKDFALLHRDFTDWHGGATDKFGPSKSC